ncbi:N-acetylmuramoyl-L-alanine amidase [Mangrovactinospora gilvigrisea]|uniref:N-acetylmuramoyl-L-alanine amidase n=1 Tax=Mangrovactinospora gilvigrisea TaxID=1428644 RepID=A0A1J7C9R7_9ACTN|nr:N-acetylmuramoyl-L-alanine amidase [Mangrovactinospora gilvigrisea]
MLAAALAAGAALALGGCGGGSGTAKASSGDGRSAARPHSASASPRPSSRSLSPSPSSSDSGPASDSASKGRPLAGRTVVIDPGHNIHNADHTTEINKLVEMGDGKKPCDTTGTSTNGGYSEASFTLDVSRRVEKILEAAGAKVVLTQNGGRSWGPCVDERAAIGNKAHADAAISIHADGSNAAGAHGFHVILPGRVHSSVANTGPILAPSGVLGRDIRAAFAHTTGSSPANYIGDGSGLVTRTDLGGLDLSTVPKVFLECGNMRNATESRNFTSPVWRQKAAEGVASGLTAFLTRSTG